MKQMTMSMGAQSFSAPMPAVDSAFSGAERSDRIGCIYRAEHTDLTTAPILAAILAAVGSGPFPAKSLVP